MWGYCLCNETMIKFDFHPPQPPNQLTVTEPHLNPICVKLLFTTFILFNLLSNTKGELLHNVSETMLVDCINVCNLWKI